MSSSLTPEARARYWRKNLSWLGGLLAVWFIVSYGCGILFVDQLDKIKLGGVPLYVVAMNRLDRKLLGENSD